MFQFSQEDTTYPPILVNMYNNTPVKNRRKGKTYIIGSEYDPNWMTYDKISYPPPPGLVSAGGIFPAGAAVTDYSGGGDNYLYYATPGYEGPERDYGLELKRIYEKIHKDERDRSQFERIERERRYRIQQQAQEEAAEVQRQEQEKFNRYKVIQLKGLIETSRRQLRLLEKESKIFQDMLNRSVRAAKFSGISEQDAREKFLSMNLRAIQLKPTINAVKTNLLGLKNELKNYQ